MPAKKHVLTDEQRRKRIRATARKIGADESSEAFERQFEKIVPPKRPVKSHEENPKKV